MNVEVKETDTLAAENCSADNSEETAKADETPSETLLKEFEALAQENIKLEKTVKRLQSSADKSDAYLTQLVAMKNDFESYKRRVRQNSENDRNEGKAEAAKAVLPVLDTFDIAKKHLDEENLKAFEMITSQFVKALGELGVYEINVYGQEFDHKTMNALSSADRGEENKGKVVEVYKKGYTMGDKVLRYAEVIVGA